MREISAAVAVIVMWGLWAFLFKIGSQEIGIRKALFYTYLIGAVISIVIMLYTLPGKMELNRGVVTIIFATLAGFAGTLIWYFVLQKHEASIITSFTALYPVVTVALSILFLKERISLPNAAGVMLAIIAGLLLSL